MKKFLQGTLAILLTSALINDAKAGGLTFTKQNNIDKLYFGGSFSHAFQTRASGDVEKKSGYDSSLPSFDIFAGKYITDSYRVELAAGHRSFKYGNSFTNEEGDQQDKQNVSIYRLMFNNYYDITTINEKFTPYIMGGVGFAYITPGKVKRNYLDTGDNETFAYKSSSNLSYQFGLGVDFQLSEKATIDLGARHINYGKMKSADFNAGDRKLKSNEFLIGIKFNL